MFKKGGFSKIVYNVEKLINNNVKSPINLKYFVCSIVSEASYNCNMYFRWTTPC